MNRRRSRRPPDGGSDPAGLSFLDTLSCGLGATVLLFLVFSALPHHANSTVAGSSQVLADGKVRIVGDSPRTGFGSGRSTGLAFADIAAHYRPLLFGSGEWWGLPSNAQKDDQRYESPGVSINAFLPDGLPRDPLTFAVPITMVSTGQGLSVSFTLKQGGDLRRHEVTVGSTTPRSSDGQHYLLRIRRSDWRS